MKEGNYPKCSEVNRSFCKKFCCAWLTPKKKRANHDPGPPYCTREVYGETTQSRVLCMWTREEIFERMKGGK